MSYYKPIRWTVEDRGYRTPCWVWQLYRCPKSGYAKMFIDGRSCYAHRYYFEQKHGDLPRRVKLDHLCRVRHCVNPAHLEPTTNAENCRRGNNTKLSADDVREIRSLCSQGWLQADIGRAYGITQANVSEIHCRKSWADL